MKPYWSDESIELYHGDWTYACPPGGLVLDLFAGSCSTAVAARATGRRAVCFEVRESQCEAAARRLDQGMLDLAGGR